MLHSFPLSPGVTLQPSSDIGWYNVKPSLDPASIKVSEVTYLMQVSQFSKVEMYLF